LIDNLPFYTEDINSIKKAYDSPVLDFEENTERVNKKTGEIYYIHKRRCLNLSFTFKLNNQKQFQRLSVRGSIHYFCNNGLHNANAMSFEIFKETIDRYRSLFGLDLTKCKLLPLENGTNIYLNEFSRYNVEDIIDHTFCVKRKMFSHNNGIDTSLISGKASSEVRIKFYSKSAQFPEECKNVLRVEDQLKKIRDLNKKGIVFVSDLYNIKNHIILLEKHLDNLSNIVLYDYTINIPSKSKYHKAAKTLNNSYYWRKLIKDCSKRNVYLTKYNDEIALLNKLSKMYGTNMLQKVKQYVEKQSIIELGLCNFNAFDIVKLPKNARLIKPKNARLYIGCIPSKNIISYNRDIKDQFVKECEVTGLDISMQKEDSSTLSSTGLKYYYKIDIEVFLRIKKEYLSINWVDSDFQKQIEEIAHNIRNYKGYRKRKQKHLYHKEQTSLFDILPNCRYIN
jgi:hypothetical protein